MYFFLSHEWKVHIYSTPEVPNNFSLFYGNYQVKELVMSIDRPTRFHI